MCYDVVTDTAPLYCSVLLHLYVPSRSLRSSADTRIFRIPRRKKKFQGQRAFSHLGPDTWNKLPYSVRHARTQSQYKTQIKTTLFRSVYEPDSRYQRVLALCAIFNRGNTGGTFFENFVIDACARFKKKEKKKKKVNLCRD